MRNILVVFFLSVTFINLYSQSANELIPKGEPFFIQSAMNWGKNSGGCWDLPGRPRKITSKTKIKIWNLSDKDKDRRYVFQKSNNKNYLRIHIDGVAGYVDVVGGKNKNGNQLQIYEPNNSNAQNFYLKYLGHGKFKIFSALGKLICLRSRSNKNGTNLVIWDDQEGPWTEWYLISSKTMKTLSLENKIKIKGENMNGLGEFYIQSALTYGHSTKAFIDAPGLSNFKKGKNLGLYEIDFYPDRYFKITNSTSNLSYYNISLASNSNLRIDVQGGINKNGANIELYSANNSSAQNFYFKYLGNGRFKIINQNGKVICTAARKSDNGTNVAIWSDQEGPWMEWYLIDSRTNKPFIPKNKESFPENIVNLTTQNNVTKEYANSLQEINNTYKKASDIFSKLEQNNSQINKSINTIGRAQSITNHFNKLNSSVDNTQSALASFTKMPIIGTPVLAASTTLNFAKSKLNKVNSSLQTIKEPVIDQAANNLTVAKKSILLLSSKLIFLNSELVKTKKSLLANPSGLNHMAVAEKCIKIEEDLTNISEKIKKFNKICNDILKMNNSLRTVDNGINNFENKFHKADAMAKEVNKILNKRFKKRIGTLKINISLKDVLQGGKVGKIAQKYVDKWAKKALRPLIKKMRIKLPEVPGINDFKSKLNNSADLTKQLANTSKSINKLVESLNGKEKELMEVL